MPMGPVPSGLVSLQGTGQLSQLLQPVTGIAGLLHLGLYLQGGLALRAPSKLA